MLVDRQGVATVFHHRTGTGIVKREFLGVFSGKQVTRNAKRSDCVPNAERLDLRVDVGIGLVFGHEILR
jgi:hypothetical protein